MDSFTPDQAGVPMIVTVVLVRLPWPLRLSSVVSVSRCAVQRSRCCKNRCALLDVEADEALQPERVAVVGSGWYVYRPPSHSCGGLKSFVDRRTIDRFAVAGRPEVTYVEKGRKQFPGV
jgi:hypothetical protein